MLAVRTKAYLPYISPTSPLHLPYISPTSPLDLPSISQARIEAMLEVLAKLTSAHRARLPPEISTQLANAVAGCKPPERSAMVAEVAPHPSPSPNPSL